MILLVFIQIVTLSRLVTLSRFYYANEKTIPKIETCIIYPYGIQQWLSLYC